MVSQQVDQRLHRFANPHHAGRQRGARQIATEAIEQTRLAVQRQAVLVFGCNAPRQCRFSEQPLGDDARRRRSGLDAGIAARVGVLHALVLQHADLLRHDVQLFADLHADLDKRLTVMRAYPLRGWQLVTDFNMRQTGVKRLAPTLLAHVASHHDLRRAVLFLGRRCLLAWGQCFGLVEEEIFLFGSARFALGREQLALEGLQLLLQQIALDRHHAQRRLERFVFAGGDGNGVWHGGLDRRDDAAFTPPDDTPVPDAVAPPRCRSLRVTNAAVRRSISPPLLRAAIRSGSFSSRLNSSQKLLRSQSRILMRSARRLRNTYMAAANGSSPSDCSTNAARPLMDCRESTASRCRYTFKPTSKRNISAGSKAHRQSP
ncbi:hypothetical protein BOBR111200_17860 [Bordetella bronchialis]